MRPLTGAVTLVKLQVQPGSFHGRLQGRTLTPPLAAFVGGSLSSSSRLIALSADQASAPAQGPQPTA